MTTQQVHHQSEGLRSRHLYLSHQEATRDVIDYLHTLSLSGFRCDGGEERPSAK